jgi:hypothetical protein
VLAEAPPRAKHGPHGLSLRGERKHLSELLDGTLLKHTNEAMRVFGHGTLRHPDGRIMPIGGSTRGVSRYILDGREEPDVNAFLPPQ